MGHEISTILILTAISLTRCIRKIKFEKKILQTMLNIKVESVSFHNFTLNKKNIILSKKIVV